MLRAEGPRLVPRDLSKDDPAGHGVAGASRLRPRRNGGQPLTRGEFPRSAGAEARNRIFSWSTERSAIGNDGGHTILPRHEVVPGEKARGNPRGRLQLAQTTGVTNSN